MNKLLYQLERVPECDREIFLRNYAENIIKDEKKVDLIVERILSEVNNA